MKATFGEGAGGSDDPASDALQPREIEITSLFASIHGYVTLAEALPASRLPNVLNLYFSACDAALVEAGGTVDKPIGDTIAAFFGAPHRQPDHAARACAAAVAIQTAMSQLRAAWSRDPEEWPALVRDLHVRIGLHSGMAVVGNMGSATRSHYTAMGDTINLAARLEKQAKVYGVPILCTGETRTACERECPGEFCFRPLGRVIVKGRPTRCEFAELVGKSTDIDVRQRECHTHFARGLACYQAQDWSGAEQAFAAAASLERPLPTPPGKSPRNPSKYYLEVIRHLRDSHAQSGPAASNE